MKKAYLSTTEVAKILGISRIAVFKKIKSGEIPAIRVGRNYAVDPAVLGLSDKEPTTKDKSDIHKAVARAFKEYGEALKKLGDA